MTNETAQSQSTRGWYVIHTQTGLEDRAVRLLRQKVETEHLENKIFTILVPTEEVVEVRKNKKRVSKRKFFPGYILLDMAIDEQTYWMVKSIPGVSGFLGEPRPTALPEEEVRSIVDMTEASAAGKPRPAIQFERGENIRIIEGPFRHFVGVVEEVNEPKAKIKAMVTIFGRPTPVELDFLQVEKI
jgi:transcriptional antiterminator NusG